MSTPSDADAVRSGELSIDSVTGVDVSLPIAGAGGRSYAFVIDWHIRLLIAIAWWVCASFILSGGLMPFDDRAPGDAGMRRYFFAVLLPAALIYFLYHPILEIAMHGRTPGKRMAGVRIVTRAGATPGVGPLLIRNVFRLIDSLPVFYCLGLVVTLVSLQHVRIGDLAAGTLLIYDRGGTLPASVEALRLAASGIDTHLAELIDDVIARWKELSPDSRKTLGRQLLRRADPAADDIEDDAAMLARLRALAGRTQ